MVTLGVDERWQGDQMDVSNFARSNSGVRYILVLIDVFSRYAFVEPLKSKDGVSVRNALEALFRKSGRRPTYSLTTDEAKEFRNASVRRLLKSYRIRYFTTVPYEIKCAVAE